MFLLISIVDVYRTDGGSFQQGCNSRSGRICNIFRIRPTVVFYIIHSFFYLIETKYFAQSEKRLL